MFLSKNFTLEEFTSSQTASRLDLDNNPTPQVLDALTYTAQKLEQVRALLGTPIIISSGYRSPKVNAAVKGASNSQHLLGEAVDFTSPAFGTPKQIVKKIITSGIEYDQVIQEYDSWVHISFKKLAMRKQALVIDKLGTRVFV